MYSNRMKKSVFLLPAFILLGTMSCQLQKQNTQKQNTTKQSTSTMKSPKGSGLHITGSAVIVYKTRNNYNDLVPVGLSDDKTKIVSYPDPKDVQSQPKPTALDNGYLLDHRGIGKNVAFLKITYEAYAQLPQAPPMDSLQKWILDKNPLLEIYACGQRYHDKDLEEELNASIQSGKLKQSCHSMK